MILVRILLLLLLAVSLSFGQEINDDILDEIKSLSTETHSDAVIIIKDGKDLYRDFYGKKEKPIYIASAGKSLASLAIGKLIDEKLLDSLNQPIHTIYPEWKQGRKKDITVRMLLNHTSGLQNHPNASIELEPAPDYKVDDIIKLALAAELSDDPGTKVSYNNKAVALLGGIVEELSGRPFDQFFEEEFFVPLGITDFSWIKDKSGNPTVHGAFVIKPSDFIKFGELILNEGMYEGKRVISKWWIRESLKTSQEFTPIWGLLWWRLPEYEKRVIDDEIWAGLNQANVDSSFLVKIENLKNVTFESKFAFYEAMEKALGKNWGQVVGQNIPSDLDLSKRIYGEEIKAYYADGFRGNYLVIIPKTRTIAVRCADHKGFNYETDFFPNFVNLISKLTN